MKVQPSIAKEILERHIGKAVSDEGVIHCLVDLRRQQKNGRLMKVYQDLWNELKLNGIVKEQE